MVYYYIMLGLERGIVRLVEYDPGWPGLYEQEAAAIRSALADEAACIEHYGSTAVPGLCAKPIIDILIGIENLDAVPSHVPAMEALDYEYKGEDGIPGRHLFAKHEVRTHYAHMVVLDGDFWNRNLLFRNFLREHGEWRDKYAALKRQLAEQFPDNRKGYTEAKTDFIEIVVVLARTS